MMGAVFSLHLFNWVPVTDCTTARLQMVPVTINVIHTIIMLEAHLIYNR